jgi:Fe-S cluster biogenesis protein NfuA
MDSRYDDIERVLRDIVAPLVEADRGEIFLVSFDSTCIVVHLAGRLAGAPGNGLFCRRVIEPVIRMVAPNTEVKVSAGWKTPEGAVRIKSPDRK